LKSAEIERRLLNNHGRARFLYDELLRRTLSDATRGLVEERLAATVRVLQKQSPAA